MDEHDVPVVHEPGGVRADPLHVGVLHVAGPWHLGALEPVVDGLGHREEFVVALDELPLGLDADVAEQADVGEQQLGHAAAEGGAVEMDQAEALERAGDLHEPLDRLVAGGLPVGVQVFGRHGNVRKHEAESTQTDGG
ncbi:MAG: hypothetical protein LC722_02835 [Actinobacteria bacterium]|nr:hypothetical protein [Actinomycetota bacterium]